MKLRDVVGVILVILMVLWDIPGEVMAAAGDDTASVVLSVVPTLECIGVISGFSGDNNRNNNATLEYREAGAVSWRSAPPLYGDRDNREYRGSIFWLQPNTEYEVRVSYTDADGVSGSPVTKTVKTRNDNPPSNGNTYYVATTGSDSNPGTQSQPFRTIQKAANVVSAGDTVLVRGGTYSETVTLARSGTVDNYITFKPFGTESVILEGNRALGNLFVINGTNYLRIKGFTLQNTSSAPIQVSSANGIIIEDNTFNRPSLTDTDTSGAIRLDGGAQNSLIQRNSFYINGGVTNAVFGVACWRAGGGHVFRNNLVTSSDGSLRDAWGGGPEDEVGYSQDNDLYNNTIFGAQDDGLQPEGGNINIRIWGNRIESCFLGIAVCPTLRGPAYIFRNVILNSSSGEYKLGDDSYGRIYLYHNTYYTSLGADGYFQTNAGLGNIVSRNNIVQAGRYVFEMGGSNLDFDYDTLLTTDATRFIKWTNDIKYESLSAFRAATGQEVHGLQAEAQFVDVAGGNLTLRSSSPCIDAGVVLAGFNDASSPWPYRGAAPDIGAYEYDSGATNRAPVLDPIGNKSVTVGSLLQFTISASDPDGNPLTYSASNLPAGASFNTSNRTFSWTPSQAGSYTNIHFEVSDGLLSDSEDITITVNVANRAPVLDPIGNKSVTVGSLLQFTISASDPDGNPLTYSASNLPAGASFNTSNRTFSWTPSQAGSYTNIHFEVSDGSLSDSEDITITVNVANRAPVLDPIGNKSVTVGSLLQFTISASDPDGNPLTYSASNLPAGASFNTSNRTFSWTPSQAGSYTNIHFEVSDGSLSDSEDITITVNVANRAPPQLQGIFVSNISTSSAVIYWTTDEPSTSQVAYWDSVSVLSPLDGRLVINHEVSLTGLAPGTKYHYRVMSRDQDGNLAISTEYEFTTALVSSAFLLSELRITPREADIGEEITISVLVTNNKSYKGTAEVIWRIGGEIEARMVVVLLAQTSRRLTYTTAKYTTGEFSVDVNGVTGSFLVREATSAGTRINIIGWKILATIISATLCIVLAVASLILYLRHSLLKHHTRDR